MSQSESTLLILPRAWRLPLLVCLLALSGLAGCSTHTSLIPDSRRRPQPLNNLEAGDTIKVTYLGAKEQSQVVKIPPDGRINLPYVDVEVNAVGKSTSSLQKHLIKHCTELTNKTIVVTLQETAKRVYVTGTSKGISVVPLDNPMTVSQVVAAAGGATEAALSRAVRLRSLENGKVVTYSLYLLKDPEPVYVKPGDEIFVKSPQF